MLKGKIALVTGSSRGIGSEIALRFAEHGADIVVTYTSRKANALEIKKQITDLGRQALVLQVDVSDRQSVRNMVDSILETFGRLDILVNNAGILEQKPFSSITDQDWDQIMAVNLKGAFICSQEVIPMMQRQKSGRIINLASSGGQLGGNLAVHYAVSKAGVICLTKSLSRIYAPDIQVNCISPGLIDTEMTIQEISSQAGKDKIKQIPLNRPGLASEVANVAVFLASDQSSYITGQTVNVNGGLYLG